MALKKWAGKLLILTLFAIFFLGLRPALALTVNEVVRDLACPCICPLVLEDCNMTCGLDWKEEVGKKIKAGMSKQEIIDDFVSRYGESARLTTIQRIEGKMFQYTRSFGTMEWTMLWSGVVIWIMIIFGVFYLGVRKLFFRVNT